MGLQPLPHFAPDIYILNALKKVSISCAFRVRFMVGNRIKECGSVTWTDKHHERMTSAGVQLMASQLLPVAQHIANKIVPLQPLVVPVVPTTHSTSDNNAGTAAHAPQVAFQRGRGDLHDLFLPYNGALINAASDCFALLKPENTSGTLSSRSSLARSIYDDGEGKDSDFSRQLTFISCLNLIKRIIA